MCGYNDFSFAGVRDVDAKWIGWAGVNVPDEVGQKALTKALATKVCEKKLKLSMSMGSVYCLIA